jgi:hypothetical protein
LFFGFQEALVDEVGLTEGHADAARDVIGPILVLGALVVVLLDAARTKAGEDPGWILIIAASIAVLAPAVERDDLYNFFFGDRPQDGLANAKPAYFVWIAFFVFVLGACVSKARRRPRPATPQATMAADSPPIDDMAERPEASPCSSHEVTAQSGAAQAPEASASSPEASEADGEPTTSNGHAANTVVKPVAAPSVTPQGPTVAPCPVARPPWVQDCRFWLGIAIGSLAMGVRSRR